MKLHGGLILTKKGDINPPQNLKTPPLAPIRGVFKIFKSFFLYISKVLLGFPNFGYDFRRVGEMFEGDLLFSSERSVCTSGCSLGGN